MNSVVYHRHGWLLCFFSIRRPLGLVCHDVACCCITIRCMSYRFALLHLCDNSLLIHAPVVVIVCIVGNTDQYRYSNCTYQQHYHYQYSSTIHDFYTTTVNIPIQYQRVLSSLPPHHTPPSPPQITHRSSPPLEVSTKTTTSICRCCGCGCGCYWCGGTVLHHLRSSPSIVTIEWYGKFSLKFYNDTVVWCMSTGTIRMKPVLESVSIRFYECQ